MARELTWTFAVNTTPTDQTTLTKACQSFLLQLKQFLVTNGWTVAYSSNSTTAGASDNWNAITDLVRASSGVHSHITLKSPEGFHAGLDGSYTGDQSRVWLTIDYLSANDYTLGPIRIHNVAPTGGSTSAVQTSTNQSGTTGVQFFRTSVAAAATFHFACTSAGMFWAGVTFNAAGRMPFFLALFKMTDSGESSGNKDYPYNGGLFAPSWNDAGNGAVADYSKLTSIYGWSTDSTAATPRMIFLSSQSSYGIGYNTTTDGWSGKVYTSPVYIYNSTSATLSGLLGRLPDFLFTPGSVIQGSADAATPNYVLSGCLFIPTDAAFTW